MHRPDTSLLFWSIALRMLRMSFAMCQHVWRRNARAVIDKWAERMLQLFGQRKASVLPGNKLNTMRVDRDSASDCMIQESYQSDCLVCSITAFAIRVAY